jgi:hypothetical protein
LIKEVDEGLYERSKQQKNKRLNGQMNGWMSEQLDD